MSPKTRKFKNFKNASEVHKICFFIKSSKVQYWRTAPIELGLSAIAVPKKMFVKKMSDLREGRKKENGTN